MWMGPCMHTNSLRCDLTFVAFPVSQKLRVESRRMTGKMAKGALCSYRLLSVMLIILMWVEIGSCWPRGGRRRSLKSELKHTHCGALSITKTRN